MIVIPAMAGGGAERVACTLLRRLDRQRFEPVLALFSRAGEYLPDIPSDVRVLDLAKRSRLDFAGLLVRLRARVRTEKPAAVLSFLHYANIVTALATMGLAARPVVALREDNNPRCYLPLVRWSAVKRRLLRSAYRRADRVIAISNGIREELRADFGVPPGKIAVIHNPIDADAVRRLAREEPRHAFFDDPDAFVVAGAGRLEEQKNFPLLLRALAEVRKSVPARLVILGQGPLRESLSALARRLGIGAHVDFVGFQANPFAWLRRADAFVLSSNWEGFGNVIVEAMACDTPVIATDCPSGPRDIISSQVNGVLVPPGDVGAMGAAIVSLLADPGRARELARRARADLERFAADMIVKEYEAVLADSGD